MNLELDFMWATAVRKSLEENNPYARYEFFAKMVAAAEREAIAVWYSKEGWLLDEEDVADAIRARGETK